MIDENTLLAVLLREACRVRVRVGLANGQPHDKAMIAWPKGGPSLFFSLSADRLLFSSRDGGCDELREMAGGRHPLSTSAFNFRFSACDRCTSKINSLTSASRSARESSSSGSLVGGVIVAQIVPDSQKSRE